MSDYFKKEMEIIQDPSLSDELTFLETIHEVEKRLFPEVKEDKGKEKGDESEKKEEKNEEELEGEGEEAAKKRKREEEENCVICWDEKKSILFLPCKYVYLQFSPASLFFALSLIEILLCSSFRLFHRHLCTCKPCSELTAQCPMCRKIIQDKTQVFM